MLLPTRAPPIVADARSSSSCSQVAAGDATSRTASSAPSACCPSPSAPLPAPLSSLQSGLSAYRARAKEHWKAHTFFSAVNAANGVTSACGVRGQWRTGQSGRLPRWLSVCAAAVIRWAARLCAGVAALWFADEEDALPGHQSPSERQRRRRRRRLQAAAACALLLLLLLLLSLHFNLLPSR